VLREPVPDVSGRDVPPALTALLMRMMSKEPGDRPDAAEAVHEFEALLLSADEPETDDIDFDDFRDELAAARVTQVAPPPARAALLVKTSKKRWKPSKGLVIGATAAVALGAVVLIMLQPWKSQQATPPPAVATVNLSATATPTVTSAVQVELKEPRDNGTSVLLEWTSSRPLTYAVNVAEQGGTGPPQTSYRGTGTSLTVPVSPGLKYCFEVQGTDGTVIYISRPKAIRGATCDR
jgi:serine/threonine protein kinase